jgi:hypothetical protein
MGAIELRTVNVIRYVTPLREGGSLPAIVEADDGFSYVIKFRGAGQGKKALIAELIGGELARAIGLKMPEIVLMNLDHSFSQTEPDEEIQDLLKFSVGLNLGLHYLSGSITYDPVVSVVDDMEASLVVLLDSIIMNIDRTVKNTNLLIWNKELWLIDHGASLYFHHNWANWENYIGRSFPQVKDHVLLDKSSKLAEAAETIAAKLTDSQIKDIVNLIPQEWLGEGEDREVYAKLLTDKVKRIENLLTEAQNAKDGNI